MNSKEVCVCVVYGVCGVRCVCVCVCVSEEESDEEGSCGQ